MVDFFGSPFGDTRAEKQAYRRYQAQGGHLSLSRWKREGKPSPDPVQVTQRTRDILARTGGVPPGVTGGEGPAPRFGLSPSERIAQRDADKALSGLGGGAAGFGGVPPQPTEAPPPGFEWRYDIQANRWIPKFTGQTAQQQSQADLEQQRIDIQRQGLQPQTTSPFQQQQFGLRQREFEASQSQFQQQFGLQQQQQAQAQAQAQAQLQFQQQQAEQAVELQRQQFTSQLAANPINWLQFAAFTGQPPVIQPWMVPLGFQNTGQGITPQGGAAQGGATTPQGLQAGQPIPGFEPTGGTPTTVGAQGTQTFANLPQLNTPSAQLQARWGPTAQAQFLGFQRARTGASPQETSFRLGSQRAPTGRFGGFSRFRT
ncbi:hypothetical protein LCGC14_2854410 [marine sediment metagenome]|uniref:Uncharacterized protein n=1 Tax=marine sediment metagenome TaxID=412755 RepID=A0A0F9AFW2_9ZZZZ